MANAQVSVLRTDSAGQCEEVSECELFMPLFVFLILKQSEVKLFNSFLYPKERINLHYDCY